MKSEGDRVKGNKGTRNEAKGTRLTQRKGKYRNSPKVLRLKKGIKSMAKVLSQVPQEAKYKDIPNRGIRNLGGILVALYQDIQRTKATKFPSFSLNGILYLV